MGWQPTFVNSYGTLDFYAGSETRFIEDAAIDCPTDIAFEKVPRRHGVYITEEPTLGARKLSFQGRILGADVATVRANLDTVMHILDGPRGKLYLNGTSGRYINCTKQDFPLNIPQGTNLLVWLYSVTFFADDPFWYEATAVSHAHVVGTSPSTWTETNAGAQQQYPTITIAADQGTDVVTFTLANTTTNQTMTYAGTITNGNSLVIDTANFTIANNGTSDWANTTGELLNLQPGANSLSFTGSNCTITIAYKNRYNSPAFD